MGFEELQALGLLLLWLAAAVLGFYLVRRPLRCRWCRAIMEVADIPGERLGSRDVIDYRCPRCRSVYRSVVGAWE
ncbi:MAG TPA: hypothetical protein VMS64_10925 [Candidatus Methylomirabilis sp.]|nr:hypothetical protein [Candidatus Methylomirabilis sp.]